MNGEEKQPHAADVETRSASPARRPRRRRETSLKWIQCGNAADAASGAAAPQGEPGNEGREREQQREAAREAMEKLNTQNRLLREAQMTPADKEVSAEMTEAVRLRFKEYLLSRGLTAAKAAREIGYSNSVISDWTKGKYNADDQPVTQAVNGWMERDARRESARRPKDYIKTWVAEGMRTIAYQADRRTMMAALVVPSGSGKTMVLKSLCEEMRGIYIYVSEGATARDLYKQLAVAIGWGKEGGTRGELHRFIVEKMSGTKRPIFVDEAHNAGKYIGALRSVFDQAEVPIIMAGTDDILRHINDRAHGRGQMSSRTIRFNAMDFLSNAEGSPDGTRAGRDLFTIEEIEKFFKSKAIRLERDSLRLLWSLACLPSHGTLRLVTNAVETALDSNSDAGAITREQIISALQLLVGGEANYLEKLAQRHTDSSRAAAMPVAKAG